MARRWTAADISDDGERVSHLQKNFDYYGHLSIYRFAAPLVKGARVLDIGCGAGYGAAYLADQGAAHVTGIDASARAIEFCRNAFRRNHLVFRRLMAEDITDFAPGSFDVVFTSNALEHVQQVSRVLRASRRLLTAAGRMVIAVPPITNDHLLYVNLMNPYHLNLWSPRQWKFAIESCFAQCTPILHGVRTIGGEPRSDDLEPGSSLDETTFAFAETMIDEMYRVPTLTAIFLAAGPRDEASAPADDDPTVFVDESFSRSSGEIPPYWKKRLEKFEPSRRDRIRLRLRSARRVFDRDGVSGLIRRSADAAGRWWRARS